MRRELYLASLVLLLTSGTMAYGQQDKMPGMQMQPLGQAASQAEDLPIPDLLAEAKTAPPMKAGASGCAHLYWTGASGRAMAQSGGWLSWRTDSRWLLPRRRTGRFHSAEYCAGREAESPPASL